MSGWTTTCRIWTPSPTAPDTGSPVRRAAGWTGSEDDPVRAVGRWSGEGGGGVNLGARVVIVGGGVMGTSIAWHLARAGVRDVVLGRTGRTRRRLHLPGRRRSARTVLGRAEHPARRTRPGGVRPIPGHGDPRRRRLVPGGRRDGGRGAAGTAAAPAEHPGPQRADRRGPGGVRVPVRDRLLRARIPPGTLPHARFTRTGGPQGEIVRDLYPGRVPFLDISPLSAGRFAADAPRPEASLV